MKDYTRLSQSQSNFQQTSKQKEEEKLSNTQQKLLTQICNQKNLKYQNSVKAAILGKQHFIYGTQTLSRQRLYQKQFDMEHRDQVYMREAEIDDYSIDRRSALYKKQQGWK